jgi:hypothetical protein
MNAKVDKQHTLQCRSKETRKVSQCSGSWLATKSGPAVSGDIANSRVVSWQLARLKSASATCSRSAFRNLEKPRLDHCPDAVASKVCQCEAKMLTAVVDDVTLEVEVETPASAANCSNACWFFAASRNNFAKASEGMTRPVSYLENAFGPPPNIFCASS